MADLEAHETDVQTLRIDVMLLAGALVPPRMRDLLAGLSVDRRTVLLRLYWHATSTGKQLIGHLMETY